MRLLAYPTCDICHSVHKVYESSELQVRVCYICLKSVADFLFKHEILEIANPLRDELLAGVWESELNNPISYQVWHLSPYSSNASMYSMIERFEEKVSKGLDNI